MEHTPANTNRKLHASLLIVMLLVFLVVFNRRLIGQWIDPTPRQTELTPNAVRAANLWNRVHADSCIKIVKNGDLVLRSGSDGISALFKRVNTRNKTYSHAGIVYIENGYPFVYHCTGSSGDPEALLKRDSLNTFIHPYDNTGYAVYRYRLKTVQVSRLHDIVIRYFKERRKFDPYFDLSTDTALYCTEFVYKALLEATGDKKYLTTTEAGNFSFVAVDDLFLRRDAKMICKIGYMQ